MPRTTLGFGEFFGRDGVVRSLPGWRLGCHTAMRPPGDVPEHTHIAAHLVSILSGAYTSAATAFEPGRPTALVYNPPGTQHRDTFASASGTFFTLSISDARLESLGVQAELPEAIRWASGPAVRRALRLTRVMAAWPPRSTARAEAACVDLLRTLVDESNRPRPPAWLVALHDRLAGTLDHRVAIRDLATSAGVHPVHAIRAFQRFYGCTPAAFARRRRLDAAALALRSSDAPIVEVALAAGFADQSHFTRAFTSTYARSPARYRRDARAVVAISG